MSTCTEELFRTKQEGMASAIPFPKLLLKPSEVAQRLGIGKTKVYDLIGRGELPALRLGPRCARISASALDAWIERQTATYVGGMAREA